MKRSPLFILCLSLSLVMPGFPDQIGDKTYKRITQIQEYEKVRAKETAFLEQTNPLKLYMVMMIRFYQVFFSKQDGPTCQFRPSCSHFGAKAIKESGPVQGLLMTSDRLQRCNPFTYGKYQVTKDGRHHRDPVDNHILISGNR